MRGAHPCPARHLVEAWDLRCGLNVPADFRDLRGMPLGETGLVWLASLARAEACLFGVRAACVKADVVWLGRAGGTRRPAINAGRLHRIVKVTVEVAIPRDDGLPSRVLTWRDLDDIRCVEHGIQSPSPI